MHGGAGYVDDHPVERWFRDVRVTTLYEGTSQIQKLIIGAPLTGINALVPQAPSRIPSPPPDAGRRRRRDDGRGIAALGCVAGRDTVLYDPIPEALAKGEERARKELAGGAERGRWTPGGAPTARRVWS